MKPPPTTSVEPRRAQLSLLVQGAIDAIFVVEPSTGRVLEANPRAAEMTGQTLQQLRSVLVWQLHPEAEQEQARQLLDRVCRQGSGLQSELHFTRPDGVTVALEVSACLIDVGGQSVIQRVCRDVTELCRCAWEERAGAGRRLARAKRGFEPRRVLCV